MRILITTVVVIAVIYTALALYAHLVKNTGMFFPDRYPSGNWNPRLHVQPQDIYFTASDGVRLHAWLFRSPAPDAPVMVWFHGNAGHLAYRAATAAEFARRGVSVFVFDYRGFGRSDGRASEVGLHLDSRAAYEHVRASLEPEPKRIVFYGESIGAAYGARVASEQPACCLIVESSFPSLRRMADAVYRPIPMGLFAGNLLLTTRWLNQAGIPVLVIHGKRDEVVPFRLGMELYNNLKVEKELFVSETAGHSEIEVVEGDRYFSAVVGFIEKHTESAGAVEVTR